MSGFPRAAVAAGGKAAQQSYRQYGLKLESG